MQILNYIVLAFFFCLTPALVLWLCRKIPFLGKIGPVLLLYFIGIVVGNLGIMPEQLPTMQSVFSNAMIPLAIPLMLFNCTFRKSETKSHVLALVTGIVAVAIAVLGGHCIFGDKLEDGAKVGGMLMGVYSGGTINLAALKAMLQAGDETYILLNSYDMIVSFLYLAFLLAGGIGLFRRLLPFKAAKRAEDAYISEEETGDGNPYKGLLRREGLKDAGLALGVTLLICAVSGGVALLLPESMFMTVFILMLTTLGIAASFIPKVREGRYSYDIGMYLIYIFCIAVASMADFSKIDWLGSLYLLGYLLVAVFGSLTLHCILARIFKVDADTMVIASVALVNSPPFVPMIAVAMRNKDVIIAGLSIGVIGYAVGNYLGFLMYHLLLLL